MPGTNPIYRRLYERVGFLWALAVFLLGYLLLLLGVTHFYLLPAYTAFQQAEADERAQLRAGSALLLAVLLVVLVIGLLLTFRLRRYFSAGETVTRTSYSDAWAQAARRLRKR
jgi:hypothetical protein